MCKINSQTIAADGQAVATACNAIATAVQVTNPTLAADLRAAATALVAATANWQTGTPTTDINTAATAIEAVLAAIPQTAAFAPFVAIAVAAIDVLLGNISTQAIQMGVKLADIVAVTDHIDTLPANPWRGQYKMHGFRSHFEGPRAAFTQAWNGEVDKTPELGFPKL